MKYISWYLIERTWEDWEAETIRPQSIHEKRELDIASGFWPNQERGTYIGMNKTVADRRSWAGLKTKQLRMVSNIWLVGVILKISVHTLPDVADQARTSSLIVTYINITLQGWVRQIRFQPAAIPSLAHRNVQNRQCY